MVALVAPPRLVYLQLDGQDVVDVLPLLSERCGGGTGGINNSGPLVGSSGVFKKGRCVEHIVLWTKKATP